MTIKTRLNCEDAMFIDGEFKEMVIKEIDSHNKRNVVINSDGIFQFKTYEEAWLWLDEFTGQISDGKYENSNKKWKIWCHLKIQIGDKTKIIGKRPRETLTFSDLMWLFDKDRCFIDYKDKIKYAKDMRTARAIFSNVSDSKLLRFINRIENATKEVE